MRVIDFGLIRRCTGKVTRHGTGGSDHHLVVYVLVADGKTFRVGQWNMQRDRNRHLVVRTCERIVSFHRLDALMLCESGDYIKGLRQLPNHTLVAYNHLPGQNNTSILLPKGTVYSGKAVPRMTWTGWRTVRGGRVPPRFVVTLVLDHTLRIAVGHRPPSVRFRSGGIRGPVQRVRTTIAHARSEVEFANSHKDLPLLFVEDWNATPSLRGRYTPHWVALRTRMKVIASKRGTHR